MITYSHIRYAMYFVSVAFSVFANWLLLRFGLAGRCRDIGIALTNRLYLQYLTAVVLIVSLLFAINLPLQAFNSYWLEHQFHLSSQTLPSWCADTGKGLLLRLAGSALVALFFLLIAKFPKRWPTLVASVNAIFIVAIMYVEPQLIEPIFNKFEPMPKSSLRSRIEVLLERADVPEAPIYIVNKSKQTNKLNAYVTGIGDNARVVIWDTAIASMPEEQILAVVGHELGHYKLNHIYIGLALALLVNFAAIPFVKPAANLALRIAPKSWRFKSVIDPSLLPLINIAMTLISFFSAPLVNSISRTMEHQADEYGLAVSGNRTAMAEAFVTLSERNLSEPNPPELIEFWLFSHPSLKSRIRFALQGNPHFPNQLAPPAESFPP